MARWLRVGSPVWLSVAALLAEVSARAEPAPLPNPAEELRLFESTERGDDPLALDESTGGALDEAARTLKVPVDPPSRPRSIQGEVISAIEPVREARHEVEVELSHGLALVTVHASFTSNSPFAAEVAYRLPLPEDAVVSALRVCSEGGRCTVATPQAERISVTPAQASDDARVPYLWASYVRDARGRALSLLASSVRKGRPLTLSVSYVAEAPVRGGKARFTLPARGHDGRAAPTHLRVRSPYPAELSPGDERERDAFRAVDIVATFRPQSSVTRSEVRASCPGRPCQRSFRAAPPAAPIAGPLWLALDVSPSMEGPARSRMDPVLAALLMAVPDAAELVFITFAQRAQELGRYRAESVPLKMLSDASMKNLGNATRITPLRDALARARASHARVVLVSDGRFDRSERERRALKSLAEETDLWLLLLDDPPLAEGVARLFRGVLPLSTLADRTARAADLEPLAEALHVLVSPLREPGLFAGEQQVRETNLANTPPRTHKASWLAHWHARHAPAPTWLTEESARDADAIVPLLYEDVTPVATVADTGMPAESVLNMLRTQLIPKARACLRTDRKGRGDYAVELTFHALFARREISDAHIEGAIAEPLRLCLEQALDELRVPAFSGRIRVRYPIHTAREPEPPVIELEPDVAREVERAIRGARPSRTRVVE